jgi:hypothetical protein
MTGRVLRSRTAEADKDNSDSSAGESITESLGSMGETEEISHPPVSESEPDPPQVGRQASVQQPSGSETNDFNSILASIMAAIQQSQESVKKDLAASNESIKKDLANSIESVKKV